MPALAPIKQFSPTDTNSVPPPDKVPIVLELPPKSLPFETITPAEILPSIIAGPNVPALKFTNPSCIIVVPLPIYAPSLTLDVSAIRTPEGTI